MSNATIYIKTESLIQIYIRYVFKTRMLPIRFVILKLW